MNIEYIGLDSINGPLVFIRTPKDVSFEEKVTLILKNGDVRLGNIIRLDEDITTIQVYQGTNEIDTKEVKSVFIMKGLLMGFIGSLCGVIFGILISRNTDIIFMYNGRIVTIRRYLKQ